MTLWDPLLRMKVDSVWLAKITRDLPDRKCFRELVLCLFTYSFSKAINVSTNNVFSEKECVNEKRDGVCMVVLLSVLLLLSLLANAVLAYLCEYPHVSEYQLCLHCVSVSQYYLFMLHRLHQWHKSVNGMWASDKQLKPRFVKHIFLFHYLSKYFISNSFII